MILAIWIGCVCLLLAHIFNDALWLVIIMTAISLISFVEAQSLYENLIKRIEKMEGK